ncbi:chorismate mutase [Rhodobacterales bacterium HKCCE2091]|nr:chorismate mutase [Rhodobacterales bacterium HKCCE2091]
MSGLDAERAEIDRIDAEILRLLALRLAVVDRVVGIKAAEGIAAAAPTRTREKIAAIRAGADAAGFDADIAGAMWQVMIDALIAREERVLGTGGRDA